MSPQKPIRRAYEQDPASDDVLEIG
ncbi:hypothetical protein [Actinopolyspora saharensis]